MIPDTAERYLSSLQNERRYSPRTVEIYRGVLEEYCAYCDRLTVSDVRNYEVHLLKEKKFGARTVNLHLSVLSGWGRYLVRQGLLESNPVRLAPRPKTASRLPEFYREESMKQYFAQTCGTAEYGSYEAALKHLIISILANTGMRRAELIGLKGDSVDFSRGTVRVLGKGNKIREIPLIPELSQEILLYLQSADKAGLGPAGPETPLLRTKKGAALYPMYVERAVRDELGTVGSITGRKSPHVLRHTLATGLLDDGTDLNSIKELLGHSSLAATQVYTHTTAERLRTVYQQAHPRAAKNEGKNGHQD